MLHGQCKSIGGFFPPCALPGNCPDGEIPLEAVSNTGRCTSATRVGESRVWRARTYNTRKHDARTSGKAEDDTEFDVT
jgi:hypothetical protein